MSEGITTYLGTFDEFEQELVLDILIDHGIHAFAKNGPTENEHSAYPGMFSDRGVILVDAARVEEAKQILAVELPQHLASIRDAMETLETTPDEPETEGGD